MRTHALEREGAAGHARRETARHCSQARTGPTCASSAVLMASEVVTNAVRYSTGEVRFGVDADDVRVRVEVSDEASGSPRVCQAPPDAESGRGMTIVDALSSGWGVRLRAGGKTVWFEVPAQP